MCTIISAPNLDCESHTCLPPFRLVTAPFSQLPHNMANEQISLPYLIIILVISGLIIRYLFSSTRPSPGAMRQQSRDAMLRTREAAVERIQQMFPQVDRRSLLWDLQRNGGNVQATTERILSGRLEAVST